MNTIFTASATTLAILNFTDLPHWLMVAALLGFAASGLAKFTRALERRAEAK